MSSSVENRIVSMKFQNNQFEKGVKTSLDSLKKLNKGLDTKGLAKGIGDLGSDKGGALAGLSAGLDKISSKFSVLGVVGFTVIQHLTDKFLALGGKMLHAITGPLIEGGKTRALNIAQAKFQFEGLGLNVDKVMASSLAAVKGTAYGLDSAAKAAAQFGASGMKAGKKMTGALRGIAGVAALSGSSFDDIADVFTKVAGQGRLMGDDLNRLASRGVNAAATLGKQMHISESDVRALVTKGKISFAQFSEAMDSAFGKHATKASETYTGALANMNAAMSRIGAQYETFKFESLRITFNALTPLIDNVAEALSPLIDMLGKRMVDGANNTAKFLKSLDFSGFIAAMGPVARGIENILNAVQSVITPIKVAFREMFPAKTAKDLMNIANRFAVFTSKLELGADATGKLKRVFSGIFALFDIGKQIIGGVFTAFGKLFGAVGNGSGGVLSFAARIGDLVVAFDKAIKSGDVIHNIFTILGNVLAIPIHLVGLLATAISGLFSGFSFKSSDGVNSSLDSTAAVLEHLAHLSNNMNHFFSGLGSKIKPAIDAVTRGMKAIGSAIAQGLDSQAFGNLLKGFNTGLLGGILLLLKKFLSGGVHLDVGGGIFGQVKSVLGGVTDKLKAMQTQLKAKALLEIAIAMGVLALAMVALAKVDPTKMNNAMTALAIGFGQLLAAMAILIKITKSSGFAKIPLMAVSLGILAGAMLLLSASVYLLSRMSTKELEKGLGAIAILLAALSASSAVLSANSKGMIQAGIGIAAIAIAMDLLFLAVKGFSTLSIPELIKGISAVIASLLGIAGAMHLMPKGMLFQAAALVILSAALSALYFAVKSFANFSYKDMLRGLAGVAGSLLAIAGAMHLMPKGMLLQAAALILVAVALSKISDAVASMAKLSWKEIGRGLAGLGGALAIIAAGLYLMEGAIGGAAALLIVAGALHVLVPILITLGTLPIKVLVQGMIALAVTFGVIAGAALLLSPAIVPMLALGVALGILGLAILAFGGGVALLGVGLTTIAAAGGAAIAVLIAAVTSIINLLPTLAIAIGKALTALITTLAKNAPAIVAAFVTILNQLLQAIPKILPALVIAIGAIVVAILKVLVDNAPKILAAGITLLMTLLRGIRDNIAQVVSVVAQIVVKFLGALASHVGQIIAAGVNVLVHLLKGIANGLGRIVAAVAGIITKFISEVSKGLGKIIAAGTNLVVKFINGIGNAAGKIVRAGVNTIIKFVEGLGKNAVRLANAAGKTVLDFIKGLDAAVKLYEPQIIKASLGLGKDIILGLLQGFSIDPSAIWDALKHKLTELKDKAKKFLHIPGGPSKFMADEIGSPIVQGIALGMTRDGHIITGAINTTNDLIITKLSKTMSNASKLISDTDMNFNPTITPVLDLTQIKKDANQIDGLVAPSPINASVSYKQANTISTSKDAQASAISAEATTLAASTETNVKFEQNNYSPKAISTIDIYRLTNNQLSQAKKSLGVTVSK